MVEDAADDLGVGKIGDDAHGAAAGRAALDVNVVDAAQEVSPGEADGGDRDREADRPRRATEVALAERAAETMLGRRKVRCAGVTRGR